jgi:hypothetical protein
VSAARTVTVCLLTALPKLGKRVSMVNEHSKPHTPFPVRVRGPLSSAPFASRTLSS